MLAESDAELPPIIVHRPTMRVIDGMHRLQAASLRGQEKIAVWFFSGDERDTFVLAVRANVNHGLPLSLADRIVASSRIMSSHPEWSDRAIAATTGLAHQTVGEIRRRATGENDRLHARVGRDGRVRPVSTAAGRILAGELMKRDPTLSLRQVAKAAGISPGTARDVRNRMRRGENPVPLRQRRASEHGREQQRGTGGDQELARHMEDEDVASVLLALRKDPSLRFSEKGRALLRLLDVHAAFVERSRIFAEAVPPHCAHLVADVAQQYAATWQRFAEDIRRCRQASA